MLLLWVVDGYCGLLWVVVGCCGLLLWLLFDSFLVPPHCRLQGYMISIYFSSHLAKWANFLSCDDGDVVASVITMTSNHNTYVSGYSTCSSIVFNDVTILTGTSIA